MYAVRIKFVFQGELVHQYLGPYNHFYAECVVVGFGSLPYTYGITPVHVQSAMIVDYEEMKADEQRAN